MNNQKIELKNSYLLSGESFNTVFFILGMENSNFKINEKKLFYNYLHLRFGQLRGNKKLITEDLLKSYLFNDANTYKISKFEKDNSD